MDPKRQEKINSLESELHLAYIKAREIPFGGGYEISKNIADLNKEYRALTGRNYEYKIGEEE